MPDLVFLEPLGTSPGVVSVTGQSLVYSGRGGCPREEGWAEVMTVRAAGPPYRLCARVPVLVAVLVAVCAYVVLARRFTCVIHPCMNRRHVSLPRESHVAL